MDRLIAFIDVVSVAGTTIGGLWFLIALVLDWNYQGSSEQKLRQALGKEIYYPKMKPFLIMLVCGSWLASKYFV